MPFLTGPNTWGGYNILGVQFFVHKARELNENGYSATYIEEGYAVHRGLVADADTHRLELSRLLGVELEYIPPMDIPDDISSLDTLE